MTAYHPNVIKKNTIHSNEWIHAYEKNMPGKGWQLATSEDNLLLSKFL